MISNDVLMCFGQTNGSTDTETVYFPIAYKIIARVTLGIRPLDSEITIGMMQHMTKTRYLTKFCLVYDGWERQYVHTTLDWISIGA